MMKSKVIPMINGSRLFLYLMVVNMVWVKLRFTRVRNIFQNNSVIKIIVLVSEFS